MLVVQSTLVRTFCLCLRDVQNTLKKCTTHPNSPSFLCEMFFERCHRSQTKVRTKVLLQKILNQFIWKGKNSMHWIYLGLWQPMNILAKVDPSLKDCDSVRNLSKKNPFRPTSYQKDMKALCFGRIHFGKDPKSSSAVIGQDKSSACCSHVCEILKMSSGGLPFPGSSGWGASRFHQWRV